VTLNLGSVLSTQAHSAPERTAIRLGDASVSYGVLDRSARGIATSLLEYGLRPGDHIALLIPNVPEFTMAYFGALYAGLVVVPLNVLLTPDEIAYHLEDSEAKLLILHPLFGASGRAGAAKARCSVVLSDGVPGEGEASLRDWKLADPLGDIALCREDDTAVILYTSGTTGRPKGAELTHTNLLLNAALVLPRLLPLGSADSALATLPLFHSFGQSCIQNAFLSIGASITLLPRFTPEDTLAAIQRDRLTLFAGVPTMYFAILACPTAGDYDISSLRYCMSGGAALPVEVLRAFEAKYDVPIQEGYGLSETSPAACFNLLDKPRKPGWIGYPVWGVEMAILDEQDRPLPDGERGEICIRGHNVMKGYFRRKEATEEAIRNGWFHSGDIGIRDADGAYAIVDRKKDMIIRGGFNIYPREVEEVLYAHPAIVEAAVLGVPHERHGEEVRAVIVVAQGETLSADDVIAYTKTKLAAYKYPRIVEFRDSLPKGPTGKILKREL
jgi:long-chain acyl-CoA synthetase